jgi:hypothetical protein
MTKISKDRKALKFALDRAFILFNANVMHCFSINNEINNTNAFSFE